MYSVIIPAAGSGSRMNLGYNKLLHKVANQTIIEHTVRWFFNDIKCRQIIIVINLVDQEKMERLFERQPRIQFVIGSHSRGESIYEGLKVVKEKIVLIHDGARPFINQQMIDDCYDQAAKDFGAICAVVPKDTIKMRHTSRSDMIGSTLNREQLLAVQTPQAFPTDILLKANELAKRTNFLELATDDASIVEKFTEVAVKVVAGDYKNIKFTTPEDIDYFEFLLRRRF